MCISGLMHSIPGGPSDEVYLHGIILVPPSPPLIRLFNPISNYTCSTIICPLVHVIIILLSYQRYCHSWSHTTIALFEVFRLVPIDQPLRGSNLPCRAPIAPGLSRDETGPRDVALEIGRSPNRPLDASCVPFLPCDDVRTIRVTFARVSVRDSSREVNGTPIREQTTTRIRESLELAFPKFRDFRETGARKARTCRYGGKVPSNLASSVRDINSRARKGRNPELGHRLGWKLRRLIVGS